jgi:ribosomal 30S subunit maturation factor RimM
MGEKKYKTEEHKVRGDNLVGKVKEIIHEGNVRRIIIRNDDGKDLIEIPLTLGLVGTLLAPAWAAIGAIAALVTNCSIIVERHDKADEEKDTEAEEAEVIEAEVEVEVES